MFFGMTYQVEITNEECVMTTVIKKPYLSPEKIVTEAMTKFSLQTLSQTEVYAVQGSDPYGMHCLYKGVAMQYPWWGLTRRCVLFWDTAEDGGERQRLALAKAQQIVAVAGSLFRMRP